MSFAAWAPKRHDPPGPQSPAGDRLRGPRGRTRSLHGALVPTTPGRELFVNSFAASEGTFLVPDSGGRWHLLSGDSERIEGAFPAPKRSTPWTRRAFGASEQAWPMSSPREDVARRLRYLASRAGDVQARGCRPQLELLLGDHVGHLEEVCRRPRTHLRVDRAHSGVARAPLSRRAANYLAAHTEDWERPTLRAVVPKRILAVVREDQLDIYENRVAVRLIDHLVTYLGQRVFEVCKAPPSVRGGG